ncbi:hypothetical protein SAMN05443247_08725 [Bradyrhizobium erythrophlei]|nr:hypothetical protein SAMN05443247_08725 [Bradyrhizobium erythrophlei]
MSSQTRKHETSRTELNLDELENVSGGRKAGGDPQTAGKEFLTFRFDTVFTTKIDWTGP